MTQGIFEQVTPEIRERFAELAQNVASELAIGSDKQVLYILQQALGMAFVQGRVSGDEKEKQ